MRPANMSKRQEEFIRIVRDNPYMIIDTETTGLHDGEICQIAIIKNTGEIWIDTLIKTKELIPLDATRIHGISNEMVADAPTWEDISYAVTQALTGVNVVCYNAVYDRKMLHKTAERWGMPKTDWKAIGAWYCAMEAIAEFNGNWNDYRQSYQWISLQGSCDLLGIEATQKHSALSDCQLTLECCEMLAGLFRQGSVPTERLL